MVELDNKINQHFSGLVVRKDLVKAVKGNAIVPSYVLEYLLGQYCATNDEDSIQTGIETVREILRLHYVHRNEAGLIRSNIREKGRYKVIDKISVALNEKTDSYQAAFSNLGINKVLVDSATVKKHPKLLVSGVWCIADVEYDFDEEKRDASPWVLATLKPIQLSQFDMEGYLTARQHFSHEEWLDVLVQSVGFKPELFGRRSKLLQVIRLIPFCERNYNLIELGPKGTGKSHIFSEFSPHGILISGGEVSTAKLFVNNATGKIGLVGYWDCVAFDEFAGKEKRVDKALVDILKNYMANKTFSRGVETLGAEASLAYVGNTSHNVPYMLKHADLFCDLPEKFHDSAFLDRMHFYIPGWEVDVIRGEMFSQGYGFVVDYLAEVLRSLRNHDYSDRYKPFFTLSNKISTRDRDGVNKTFSGLMKLMYPSGEASKEQIEELLKFALEGRKRVKDQLFRIDSTYPSVEFSYTDNASGKEVFVTTLEEREYPAYYYRKGESSNAESEQEPRLPEAIETEHRAVKAALSEDLKAGHLTFEENQKGVSYESLFAAYLRGASTITVTDPYIRLFYQQRNFMEFMEMLVKSKLPETELKVHLITVADEFKAEQQIENFAKIQESASSLGIAFTWEFQETTAIHARSIVSDTGWKISLDRGLDIFQQYDMNDTFAFTNRLQQQRQCKPFEVTFIQI